MQHHQLDVYPVPKVKTPLFILSGILDNYIIPGYDVLHSLGKEYLGEDITDFVREKGVQL